MAKFCPNCGKEVIEDSTFCESCGAKIGSGGGKFVALDEFNTQQKMRMQPTMMSSTPTWKSGGIVKASVQMLTKPADVSPSLLQDPKSPNHVIIVLLSSILSSVVAILTSMKVERVVFTEDVPESLRGSLESSSATTDGITIMLTTVVTLFLFWFVGSWILAALLKNGFPVDTLVRYEANLAMRRLNAYRMLPGIFLLLIQIFLLYLQPNQTVTYSMQTFLGVETPIPAYSGFTDSYYLTIGILQLISAIYSIFILYKGVMSMNYSGFLIFPVIIFLFFTTIYPIFGNL